MARRRNDAFSIKFESHGIAHEVRACVLHTFRHTEEKKKGSRGVRRAPNHATTVRSVGGVRSGQVKKKETADGPCRLSIRTLRWTLCIFFVFPHLQKKILSPSFDKNGIRGECRNYA